MDTGTRGSQSVVPPAYAGVSLLLSWIYLLFYARSAGIEAAAPVSLMSAGYTTSAFCMTALLLIIAFLPRSRFRILTANLTKVLVPLLMSGGSVVLILGEYLNMTPCIYAGGVLTGVASGIMAQQWIVAYKNVGLHTAILSFPVLMVFAICVCMTLMYLPGFVMTLAIVVLPVISELMFHSVRHEVWPEFEVERAERNRPLNYVLLLVPFFVYGFSSGFLDYFSGEQYYTFIFYALFALIPLLIAGIYVFIAARPGFFSAFLVPFGVLIVALVPFLSLGGIAPMAQFVSIGELGIEVVVFIVAVGFSDFFSLDPLRVYALSRAVIVVFNTMGWYVAEFSAKNMPSLFNSQAILLVLFVAVEVLAIALTISVVKARKTAPKETDSENDADDESKAETPVSERPGPALEQFEARCARIAREYDLSKRETDVFLLLSRGYSSARIQQELYIAAGTVNYHTRNIYAKLGVHSKQEVIDLVERSAQD